MKKVQQPYYGWTNIQTMEAFENIVEEVYNQYPQLRNNIRYLVERKTDLKIIAKTIRKTYKKRDVDYIKLAQVFTDLYKTDHMVLKTKHFTTGVVRIKKEDIEAVLERIFIATEDVFFVNGYGTLKTAIKHSHYNQWCWFKTIKQAIDLLKQIDEELKNRQLTNNEQYWLTKINKLATEIQYYYL